MHLRKLLLWITLQMQSMLIIVDFYCASGIFLLVLSIRKLHETFRALRCTTTTADTCCEAGVKVSANNATTATTANDVELYQSYNTITNDRMLCMTRSKRLVKTMFTNQTYQICSAP